MRVGVDSYSYHRLYGEIRAGETRPDVEPWPLEPAPVLAHVARLGIDEVYLETCYVPLGDELVDERAMIERSVAWLRRTLPG